MNVIERHFAVLHKCAGNSLFTFKFISLSVLIGISAIAFVANAEEPEQTRATLRENAETRIASSTEQHAKMQEHMASTTAAKREAMQETIEERRGVLTTRAQERITMLGANMSNRMEAVIRRFEQIIDRLEKRMVLLEENGVDTTAAKTHVQSAKDAAAQATALLSDIDAVMLAVSESETPREAWAEAKSVYSGAREALRTAHTELRAAVAALKDAVAAAETGTGVSDAVQNENSSTTNSSNE